MFQLHRKLKTPKPALPHDFLRQVPEYHTYRAVRLYFLVAYLLLGAMVIAVGIFLYQSVFRAIEQLPEEALIQEALPKEVIDTAAFHKVNMFAETRATEEPVMPKRNPFAGVSVSSPAPASTVIEQ